MKVRRPKILLVRWIDSHTTHGWHHKEEYDARPAKCESIGYLLSETKDSLTLAQSRSRESGGIPWADFITIPKVSIKKRTEL